MRHSVLSGVEQELIGREDTGSKRLLHLDLHPTGWVPPQYLFLFNQPLANHLI